ncbi:xylulokinase [Mycolicibacterium mengxianglii]|uniref:xylulokinase n=1 Tax=Mycolicibacterium mengxianglii TaxID=2736649 RepID=UPI0018EEEB6C|nr:FGGY family carbohydrate kinase [Mycolicibacterium mengxianglii]
MDHSADEEDSGMAGADLVLAVDCSTSGAKAVVFGPDGRSLSSGRQTFPMAKTPEGRHEQNAHDWWRATSAVIKTAMSGVDRNRVAAVAVTHQRETFVCIDDAGEPVRPAIVWADNRSVPQVARYGSEETHRISGRVPDITPAIFKLAWLREHEPETLRRSARVADVSAFLHARLTGRWVSSASSCDSLGLMDLASQQWSPELCAIAGVDPAQLPEIATPGGVIGPVVDDIAAELGLAPGTLVVAAAGDGQCAALGTGVTEADTMYLNVGTALVAGYVSPDYRWSRKYRTVLDAAGQGYLLEAFTQSGTYLVSWFIDTFAPALLAKDTDAGCVAREEDLEHRAGAVPPGSDGLFAVPYWNGAQTPYWEGAARGTVLGWSGIHTGAHFYRSLLEGAAYEVRLQVEGVESDTGVPVSRFLATGGGSRSPMWSQIIADVTGRQVDICAESETTALGAAMMAGCAVGIHSDLRAAAAAMTRTVKSIPPRPDIAEQYQAMYQRYLRIYPTVRELSQR